MLISEIIEEGPKDFDDMKLDAKGKQDSLNMFYHDHAPTMGKPTPGGVFNGFNIVNFSYPEGILMFLVDQNDQAVFYVAISKYKDGVAVGNVRSNGIVKATDVYSYLVKKYRKLYSDEHQTPAGRKIWANLEKFTPLKISDTGERLMATETIKTFGPRSDWFDKAIEIYNAKGLDALFTYVSTSKTRDDIATVRQDFMSDMDQYTTRDEAVEEWLIFLDNIHSPLTNEITEAPLTYAPGEYPEWYDKAVALKKQNPKISATEIGRQVGITTHTILVWLVGNPHRSGRSAYILNNNPPFSGDEFPRDFPFQGYAPGAKPEWYDQAVQMRKQGMTFKDIGTEVGVSYVTVMRWLVKGKISHGDKIQNPDAPFEPSNQKQILTKEIIYLLKDFILDRTHNYSDAEIVKLIADEKGHKIAGQVRTMLPALRQELNPGTKVIDKTRAGPGPEQEITL